MKSNPWTLRIAEEMMNELMTHLFPGDGDEHGAVIGAVPQETRDGTRLLAQHLFIARDGIDYVIGRHGYRMLTAEFVTTCVLECAANGLAYLAVHCHSGQGSVAFSGTDLTSHERGYPALLDILDGPPVGGIVFAQDAVAGDIWTDYSHRVQLNMVVVTGETPLALTPSPRPRPASADAAYDRQARLFGDHGQLILQEQKVGVVGAGGAGSLIIEQLARLGVGTIVVVDPDRIELSNIPRVVGARRHDARPLLTHAKLPGWLTRQTERLRTRKVSVSKRLTRGLQKPIHFVGLTEDITTQSAVDQLVDCDYLFLAADSMQARLVVNAIVHQYLIPGVQVGAKVQVDATSGDVLDVFTVVRHLIPGRTCLMCNGLINASRLAEEATDPNQRKRQGYVTEVPAPSVISLNAVAVSQAVNDYLFSVTGMADTRQPTWHKYFPMTNEHVDELPRRDPHCRYCGERLGAGPSARLPVKNTN